MAYTETGKEKEKREAYYKANKERGIRQEKQRDYEMFGTTEQNIPAVDTMGNVTGMKKGGSVKKPTMKYETYTKTGKPAGMKTVSMDKGGKVMKKTKKFDEGGRIGEDVRERAMRSVANLTDEGDVSTIARNEYGDITPTLASMEKTAAQKTRVAPVAKASKSEYDDNSPLPEMPKKSSVDELKNMVYSTADKPRSFKDAGGSARSKVFSANLDELSQKSIPSSFKDTGGNTRSKVSNASLSGLGFSKPRLYDPLAKYDRKPEGMKSGGKVKSASARADGCCIRGKTKA
jgi:hypothetical protein